jgi:basic membrane protein A and related proteins
MKKLLLIICTFMVSVTFVFAGGKQKKEVNVALMLSGSANDLTWSYAADQALKKVAKKLGYVNIIGIAENVAEGDAESFMRDYADNGADIVIANTFGFFDAAHKITAEDPDLVVVFPGGDKSLIRERVATYYPLGYQSTYLIGITAALASKTKKVGYIVSNPIPPLLAEVNAFYQGVKDTNPAVSVDIMTTGSWFDPTREAESAQALAGSGVDFIAFQLNSLAVVDVAKKRGIMVAPPFADQRYLAPDNVAVCSLWNWESYYEDMIKKVKAGTWKTSVKYWGIKEGMADISEFGSMISSEIKAKVLAKREEIINGSYTVPYVIDRNLWE